MSSDTQANPILSGYETYLNTTPLATRYILNTATIFYILSFFLHIDTLFSCIPSEAILHFQIYRFLTSPFLCDSLLALLFSYLSLIQHGNRLEFSMGSTNFAAMVLTLSWIPTMIISILAILSGNDVFMIAPLGGIWHIVFSVIAVECALAPVGEKRRFFVVDVPTVYYPCILLLLISLFSGGTFPFTYACSVGVGYLYGFGKLDVFKLSYERRRELEDGVLLRRWTSMQGFVSGPNVDTSWTISDPPTSFLGSWSNRMSNNSRGGSGDGDRRNNGSNTTTTSSTWQPTVFRRPTENNLHPSRSPSDSTKTNQGKGYRLGGSNSYGPPSGSDGSRQQHQTHRDAILAAAERRATTTISNASTTSTSGIDEESNERDRLLR